MSSIVKKIRCPACGDTEYRLAKSYRGYLILICQGCKLSFADPMLAGSSSYYKKHFVYQDTDENAILKNCHSVANGANRRLLSMVPQGSRIFDVGCGASALVHFALERVNDAYGIDFNDEQIYARRKFLNLGGRLILSDFEELRNHIYSENKFNLIILFEVIEHIVNPQKLIKYLRELLVEGGLVAVSCPNEMLWQPVGRIFVDYPPHHLTRWRRETLVKFLEREGFEHLKTEIDSSFSDIFWVAYVNHSAKRKLYNRNKAEGLWKMTHVGDTSSLKRVIFNLLKFLLGPFDLILKMAYIGTMGMRIIVRKK